MIMTRSMARSCGLRLVPPMIISSAAATAIQLLTLGIPCLYYGTEQGFAGPEEPERVWLPGWGGHDRYLREAMFGPRFPRAPGRAGLPGLSARDGLDHELPGFGPFGTAGAHSFDPGFPLYLRTAAITAVRSEFPVLRSGRQYSRPVSVFCEPFGSARAGELFGQSYGLWCCVLGNPQCRPERGPVAGQPALN